MCTKKNYICRSVKYFTLFALPDIRMYSTAMGRGPIANAYYETVMGSFNTNAVSPTANLWIATDRLFTVGNGSSPVAKSNALVILKNGNTTFTGNVTAPAFVTSSDRHFKTNIVALNSISGSALANLSNIRSYYYDYKVAEFPERQFSTEKQIGFIAQELEAIYPELVKTDKKGYKSVDYVKVTPILVEAIKELKAENEALKAESNVSKQDLNLLKAQVEKLNDATFGNAQK